MVERRQAVLVVVVVDGGEGLEREMDVVVDRQVQGDVLLDLESVKEVRRLEELVDGGAGDVGGEGVRGRSRCILQHKSEAAGSDQSCAQDCDPKQGLG